MYAAGDADFAGPKLGDGSLRAGRLDRLVGIHARSIEEQGSLHGKDPQGTGHCCRCLI